MLYHVSPTAGLKKLTPRVSTHGKAYVYAIENMATGLLFGVRHDDFDFNISTDSEDRPMICECYPGAFQSIFQGKGCSVYTVSDEGFERGRTGWEPELVCEREVPVLEETVIPDLCARLLELEAQGQLIIRRYEHTDEYRRTIAAHIVDRIIRFDIDLDRITETDRRFATHYKGIVELLRSAADGHLLP